MATNKVVLEVSNKAYDVDAIAKEALKNFEESNKATVKDFQVYVKPEDGKAYYVVNGGKYNGDIDI